MTDSNPRWYHRLYVGLQYLLPQHLLSALMFRATRVRWRPLKALLIRAFLRLYRVDMTEARESDPGAYATFNQFFTRPLRTGARPLAVREDAVACPADGVLSQLGTIAGDRIFQAKGQDYSLLELLGGNRAWAERLAGGQFATIYLSPRDYHRVHMPLAGTLRQMQHVPGRLFAVNPVTAAQVPRLFTRNERVLCLFDGEPGPFALILVGAIFVGSMETVWAGQVTPTPRIRPDRTYEVDEAIHLEKGAEMGRFNMGSTVILLIGPDRSTWSPGLRTGDKVRMGERIGQIRDLPSSRLGG
jgi:phosphatidylserine decarboxylase